MSARSLNAYGIKLMTRCGSARFGQIGDAR
jgi:hypothetical protein